MDDLDESQKCNKEGNKKNVYKIIPFIVDGKANSNNNLNECFPELLRNLPIDEQIRGIDVRGEDGKEGAYINVIATMLRVRYDELYQRYIREKKRKIYSKIAMCVIALIMSIYMWDYYFNTKYDYYLDYFKNINILIGDVTLVFYAKKFNR